MPPRPSSIGVPSFAFENLVVLEEQFGRGIRDRITLGFGGAAQGANWAVRAIVCQHRTAHRAGSFGRGCRHRMLLGRECYSVWVSNALRKSLVKGGNESISQNESDSLT